MSALTRQEMFDRAVRGLAGQGWRPAFKVHGNQYGNRGQFKSCCYSTPDPENPGKELRCAWGHVDLSLTSEHYGTVWAIKFLSDYVRQTDQIDGIPVTTKIDDPEFVSPHDRTFASWLQSAHDLLDSTVEDVPKALRARFVEFAQIHELIWPGDVP